MLNKKHWTNVCDFVDYWKGYREMQNNPENEFLTRKDWNGIHYINRYGEYCILLRSEEIIVNPVEIYDIELPDWIMVDITDEAKALIKDHSEC